MIRAKALSVLVAATLVASLVLLAPSSAKRSEAPVERTRAKNTTVLPIEGFHGNGERSFEGDLTVKRVVRRDGKLKAVGRLDGTVFNRKGNEKGSISDRKVTMPLRAKQASCEILRLVLGPLDLNLLGLRIELNRVILNITAEPGPGNLLGNLLCAIAGLLDGPGQLGIIRNILNAILEVLRLA